MAVRAQNKVTPKDFFLDCGSDDATASRPFFIVYSLQTNELDSPDRLPPPYSPLVSVLVHCKSLIPTVANCIKSILGKYKVVQFSVPKIEV